MFKIMMLNFGRRELTVQSWHSSSFIYHYKSIGCEYLELPKSHFLPTGHQPRPRSEPAARRAVALSAIRRAVSEIKKPELNFMRPRAISLVVFSPFISATILLSPATAGDLYKWTDEKGQVHYTSTPPPDTAKKAKTLDTKALSKINALPSDPNANSASVDSPADDSDASPPATPAKTASGKTQESTPANPPALIPASLLPPSNPPATAKPEQPAQSDIIEVVAQGMGTDQPSALNNAYSNAVQQALGLYVDAETMVQNDQIVRDQILTYSKGFIEKADIVSQSQANGLFQVNIRAKVQRQKLLEKAKASNISLKQVEGVSLHARVETQIKQEQDAKALLEKTLQPLMDATLLRAELLPDTKEQPNPTINKAGTNDQFVTLDYKVSLWIDESEYYKYVKNSLIPVLNQIATRKGELTVNYEALHSGKMKEGAAYKRYDEKQETSFSVLTWGDKGLTISKWQWFALSVDKIPGIIKGNQYGQNGEKIKKMLCSKAIELNLLDEKGETIALGNSIIIVGEYGNCANGKSTSPMALNSSPMAINSYEPQFIISPYFTENYLHDERVIIPPKSGYFTISVKTSKEDLPRVKSAKLEVKSAGE